MTVYSSSEQDTFNTGAELAGQLAPGSAVALYGELGAGKTAFVRGLAAGLGIDFPVTSPTFTIVNEYPGVMPLFHFDLYRISSTDELFELGWDEYFERGGVVAAEWCENVPGAFTDTPVTVRIDKTGDDARRIEITFPGDKS